MEENQNQEKTEQATPKRKQEARDKGQVPRSRELNTVGVMLAGASALLLMGDQLGAGIAHMMREGLSHRRSQVFDPEHLVEALVQGLLNALQALAPFLLVVLIAAIATPMFMGGWSFSIKAMAFKAEKLDPIKGLKRIFALRGLIEMLKAMGKFVLVGAGAVFWLRWLADDLLSLSLQPVTQALYNAAHICALSLLVLSAVLVIIAAIDVPFQLWDHSKKLRMTKQEVRDEAKDTEGKPEIKSRIRQAQQEVAQRRMMEEVPKADVIVTNPTHYAVALKYDQSKMRAPRVVAKGTELVAARIREIAEQHNVPLFSAPPLARALFASTKLGKEIPVNLYAAVAQVLTYVYQLKQAKQSGGLFEEPEMPSIDDLDDLMD